MAATSARSLLWRSKQCGTGLGDLHHLLLGCIPTRRYLGKLRIGLVAGFDRYVRQQRGGSVKVQGRLRYFESHYYTVTSPEFALDEGACRPWVAIAADIWLKEMQYPA